MEGIYIEKIDKFTDNMFKIITRKSKKFEKVPFGKGMFDNFYEIGFGYIRLAGFAEIINLENNKVALIDLQVWFLPCNYTVNDVIKEVIQLLKTKYKDVMVNKELTLVPDYTLLPNGEITVKMVNILEGIE